MSGMLNLPFFILRGLYFFVKMTPVVRPRSP